MAGDEGIGTGGHAYLQRRASKHGRRKDKRTEHCRGAMTVATLDVRDRNDAKLELALQYLVAEEWDILFLIDTQLDMKGGDYMGKKIK